MDYDKMYFPKTEMSQLVPTGSFSPETYAAYAESFDLSLLPTDSEISLGFNCELSQCQSEYVSLDFIPTTINEQQQQQQQQQKQLQQLQQQQQQPMLMTIKSEKPWSNEEIQLASTNFSTNSTDSSILLQQLQKQYQFYPSPLPSPPQYEFNNNSISGSSSSICSPASSSHLSSPSPSPSIENNSNFFHNFQIKKEFLILPPSPPESNGAPSPFNEIKSEPDIETEIDINSLLEKSLVDFGGIKNSGVTSSSLSTTSSELSVKINSSSSSSSVQTSAIVHQDHQVLREYLQDTTFQKKHNLKPLALESLIGGFGVRGDIEPVISLALEHAKRDAQATCANLQISPDPQQWTTSQVHSWIRSTIEQFKLSSIDNLEMKFTENGANLLYLTEDEFIKRLPESGGTIHAQLEIWKLACCENFLSDLIPLIPSTSNWDTECHQNMDITDDEDNEIPSPTTIINNLPSSNTIGNCSPVNTPSPTTILNNATTSAVTQPTITTTPTPTTITITTTTTPPPLQKPPRTGGSHIHLWQFLKELLATPQLNGTAIRWLDRNKGVFKIEDSVRVAKLWGRRKNRPAMNYDKLSRSIRQYYKKGIMKKTERSQRLVYQFCHPYCL